MKLAAAIPLRETPAPRLPALDGLRFLAVAGVMAVHFSPGGLARIGPWGEWGVRVFFVLSGFLITGILLAARARSESGRSGPGAEYRRFFIRRALRLWPAYLATLGASLALGVSHAWETLPWNLGFATNYYITVHQSWPGLLSHLWTLAVEFQFYLFWPLLLLFAPRSAFRVALVALIAAGPVFRLLEWLVLPDAAAHFLLLPATVDYFALGAWIALPGRDVPGVSRTVRPGAWAALCLAASLFVPHLTGWAATSGWRVFDATLIALGAWFLVRHFLSPEASVLKNLCSLRPLVYLGRISYGIYLYHNLAHRLSPPVVRRLTGENYLPSETAHVAGLVLISLLLAILSWHLIEQPVERLRRQTSAPAP